MATGEESDLTFPEVNASRELNLGVPEQFQVDPISSNVESAKKQATVKAKAIAEAEAEAAKRSTLMSALVVSGVAVAAIGVAIIITKKLKQS